VIGLVVHAGANLGIVDAADGNRRAILAADGPFKEMELLGAAVEYALEFEAVADGPVDRNAPIPRTRSSSSSNSSGFFIGRSHLFMKVKIGTPRWRHTSKSLRVCGSMPLRNRSPSPPSPRR